MADPDEPSGPPAPPKVSRHVQPLGPRVLVRIVRGEDRTGAGLYLPQGAREEGASALLGEVVEVARALPKIPAATDLPAPEGEGDDDDHPRADLGANVSGIPLGAHVLFAKDEGIPLPWDDDLRLIAVRHVLALVDIVPAEQMQ